VGLINVPLTYPPKALNGFIVSGLLSPNLNSGITYPPSLLSKILSEIGDYQIDLSMDRYGRGREVDFLKDLHHLTSLHKKTSLHLMQSCPWDFFMTVFIGGDRIQHAMWNYFDNQHPAFRKEKARRFGDAILHYYQQIDKYIGEVLRLVDDDTVIVVLSDHGFGALEKRIYVNSWLQDLGLLSLRLPDMASETGETSYDFISRSLEASVKAPKHAPSLGSCRIGDDERPVIFQPPPSEITYRLRLGPQPVLKFGITIHPDVWAPRYGAGVCFEILVCKGLRRRTLFSRYIDPKNRPQERRWHDFVIDLGEYSGDKVSITFKTSPDGYHNYAIWSRPIMVESTLIPELPMSLFIFTDNRRVIKTTIRETAPEMRVVAKPISFASIIAVVMVAGPLIRGVPMTTAISLISEVFLPIENPSASCTPRITSIIPPAALKLLMSSPRSISTILPPRAKRKKTNAATNTAFSIIPRCSLLDFPLATERKADTLNGGSIITMSSMNVSINSSINLFL